MLKKLASGLRELMKKLLSTGHIDEKVVNEIIKDLQKILIEADVNIELVFKLSERIKERILKEKPLPGFTQREHAIKVIYDELVKLVGEKQEILLKPCKILLIGLFGSGKTTTAGKLALWYRKRGLRPGLVGCDIHRPAAMDQLEQIAKQISVPYFISRELKDAVEIAKQGIEKLKKADVLIFDSAGRDALDEELAEELKRLKQAINPDEVLLIIPADLGQVAKKQAEEFHKLVGITGVVITKLDGTAKGGGALTACATSGAPVKFIGFGEKLDAFDVFDPKRFISRLIGMGDIEALLEKAKEVISKEKAKTLQEKLETGKFDLNDFKEQLLTLRKMGSLSSILEAIPGLGMALPKGIDLSKEEEKIKKWCVIIDSMTKEERANPEIINSSRIKRIAKGSGTKEEDVRELLRHYEQAKKIAKMIRGRGMIKFLRKFGLKL
ncbi:MAG TPA: signal recognition particle protein [Nanoarchaeota archaeon]|nr:signal recognition particle protein [Nanoarchaeota archaeon]